MRGDDLAGEDDPLIAEIWASQMLGTFYKMPLPIHVRDDFEKSFSEGLVEAIEEAEGHKHLAVLRALAAVAPDQIGPAAHARAEALVEQGIADPAWATEIGKAEFIDAWMTEDPNGDQRGYYARFRYPCREAHTVTALYDVNLGGIVKNAFAGYTKGDLRAVPIPVEKGLRHSDVSPGAMASEILAGVAMGDMYVENDWSEDFKKTRALLVTPYEGAHRRGAFRSSRRQRASVREEPQDARRGVSPMHWRFALPIGLKAWVRFTLSKRGLEERWISETEAAIDRWEPKFKKEVADPDHFGMAKAIGHAMMAAGVDLTDQRAVDEWINEFNRRPFEERDEFLKDR